MTTPTITATTLWSSSGRAVRLVTTQISYDRMNSAVQRRTTGHRTTGTPERLVAAARECLRTWGAARTSSRAITDLAGANLASITYYFGSKDALVAAALAQELDDWLRPVLDRLAEPGDPALRLVAAIDALQAIFEAQHERVAALLEVFVQAARDGGDDDVVARTWADFRDRLATVIAELRERDVVPPWVEPESMASLILVVAAGTAVGVTVAPDTVSHRAVASQFAGLLLAARSSGSG
jgi:AcrR family transcriptional regulator